MGKVIKNRLTRLCAGVAVAALLLGTVTVEAAGDRRPGGGGFGPGGPGQWDMDGMMHGTAEEEITEDLVNNTPPTDYVVDESIHGDAADGAYNAFFLEDSLQTVYIELDENNLNYLLQNAQDAPSVMTNSVTIGDVTLGYCGLKTKGNYTLSHSYTDNPGSDRFSFTINFGKYIKKADYGKKQNFYGANKISFNNFYFDKSMMKEFFALKLMDEMGLPTPQYGLAKLYINGEYYGVYAMIEAMDESILEQYYNVDDDELSSYLCKPTKTTFLYEKLVDDDSPLWENDKETYEDVKDMLPTVMEWVRKLNCLSEGTDFEGNTIDVNSEEYLTLLEQIMDVDETLRYFATHSWLCQMDNMFTEKQNFGLYIDADGKSLMIPWDYDLSFGCYYPSEAESTANYPVEVMFKGVADAAARIYKEYPLFNVIYQNEVLMEQYKDYMAECSQIAALGGTVEHTGKTYEPGYFNSYIEKMEQEIYQAASEELADNVYYMNRTNQPEDVQEALPNLSKIIAMRAVGVWEQVKGTGATVCGGGCDLSTLGNANRGRSSSSGVLSVVNEKTGIFVTADFGEKKEGQGGENLFLEVETLSTESEEYLKAKELLGASEEDGLVVYQMNMSNASESGYTLHIPLSQAYMDSESELHFYRYDRESGTVTELAMTGEDNLYTGSTDSIGCIIVHQKASTDTENNVPFMVFGVIAVLVIIKCLSKNIEK